ncbi:hypothetical protein CBR_g17671 [Chara braunii]|uniref:Matrin-type domain-containing protein n=1 Tax=Chara braunii TaxID=69332 RepID=A0A388KV82_CHABU|nr:hypothetical protein CBR_g17671 [Chara braunii]|eukprot:GBG73959.1 hypothetical protein CBR_g17671 [Chara braunii]
MTEYWVSQGNKWCEYCRIYIANNATSIRMHEFGNRHKENVAKRLAAIRRGNVNTERERERAMKELELIEEKARVQYEKDLSCLQGEGESKEKVPPTGVDSAQVARPSHHTDEEAGGGDTGSAGVPQATAVATDVTAEGLSTDWVLDPSGSGYYYNASSGYYYDPNSGLYYGELHGRWVTQEEAMCGASSAHAAQSPLPHGDLRDNSHAQEVAPTYDVAAGPELPPSWDKDTSDSGSKCAEPKVPRPLSGNAGDICTEKREAGPKPAAPLSGAVQPKAASLTKGRGVSSSLEVSKRKREAHPSATSEEEMTAIAKREAARARTAERHKKLMGLYG